MLYNLDFQRTPIINVNSSNSRTTIDFSHRTLPSYIAATLGTDPKIEQNLAVELY